jgi:hypothetical protein
MTPLGIAANDDHWKAADEILEHDPTMLARDAECLNTQLHKASLSGDFELCV